MSECLSAVNPQAHIRKRGNLSPLKLIRMSLESILSKDVVIDKQNLGTLRNRRHCARHGPLEHNADQSCDIKISLFYSCLSIGSGCEGLTKISTRILISLHTEQWQQGRNKDIFPHQGLQDANDAKIPWEHSTAI